jgi:glycosyltransferase involved in cell wall biosynthesis
MVVGLVTPRYSPAVGGVERHVEMLARGLVRLGARVEVVTTDPTGKLARVELLDGVLVRRFPTVARDAVYFVAPQLGWWLLRNGARFDVLHAHSYHTPLALQAAVACSRSGTPLVVTPHYHGTGHSRLRRALHLPYRASGAWLLRKARRVICVSRTERALLHSHFGDEIATAVIPNGVELPAATGVQADRTNPSQVLVLAVGRLEHYKQVERIVAALPFLPHNYELAVVGEGPARSHIEQTALMLGVQARLRMLGRVSDGELQALYRRADAYVSLSRQEAFGLTVLEAAVSGPAVVASDIPAHGEVAGYLPSGRLTLIGLECSPAELAEAVQQAARTERAAAIHRWPLPTWEQAAGGALACYREALGDTPPLVLPKVSA